MFRQAEWHYYIHNNNSIRIIIRIGIGVGMSINIDINMCIALSQRKGTVNGSPGKIIGAANQCQSIEDVHRGGSSFIGE